MVVVAALGWFVATDRLPRGATDEIREQRVDSNRLLGLVALFVVSYVVVLYLTATLFDAGISVEGRLLVPIQVAGAVLVVGLVYRAVVRGRRAVGGTAVAIGAAIVVVVLCAWPWRQIAQGFGTTSTVDLLDRGFQPAGRSPLGDAVAALPRGALVASTFPPTLYSASGHDVVFVPPRWDRMSGERNDEFRTQLIELGRLLEARGGYLALYDHPPEGVRLQPAELARIMRLDEVGRFADGSLYRVKGLQPGGGEAVRRDAAPTPPHAGPDAGPAALMPRLGGGRSLRSAETPPPVAVPPVAAPLPEPPTCSSNH